MKKLLMGIELVITLFAVILQMPYILIAGAIVSYQWEPFECSNNIYIWLPTIGIEAAWIDTLGRIDYEVIFYKELFN